MYMLDSYDYGDADLYGVAAMDDTELTAREQLLRNEIDATTRLLRRFEEFCERADLAALGDHGVEALYDNAAGLDHTLEEDAREHASVLLELTYRKEADAHAGGNPAITDDPSWFWNF